MNPHSYTKHKWVCTDLQNGPRKWKQHSHAPELEPIHFSTPPPSDPLPSGTNDVSAFDIIPGDACGSLAFFLQEWAKQHSFYYHFKLTFQCSYPVNSLWQCTCFTLCPNCLCDNHVDIPVTFCTNTGTKKSERVRFCDLAPASVASAWPSHFY